MSQRQLCGVVSEAKYKARERRRNTPQPWIVLKLMVGVTLGLLIYAAYVYIGRFCVESIQSGRFTQRGTAIGLLVGFCVLWLWTMWAYVKIVITPPGFARDYVHKTPQPLIPHRISQSNAIPVSFAEEEATMSGPPYEQQRRFGIRDVEKGPVTTTTTGNRAAEAERAPYVPPAYVGELGTTPVLHPAHRYCQRDGFVKPYRAHHCRACGTCVLRFDHHCPCEWDDPTTYFPSDLSFLGIGQCVGARNHKFFVNFNFAACVFTAYTFATLLAFNIHAINSFESDIDAQSIVIIALAALFTIFTGSLLFSHAFLIWKGQSTVESLEIKDLKERVKYRRFNEEKGCIARPDNKALREYTKEWGPPDREGYIWWMGSNSQAWEDVMGTNPLGWFLPIGRPLGDGLTYAVNPRFDAEGRRRRKSDWPDELRT